MAIGKEIRTKIKSVQNTQKITRAMEMDAASKMRKAQGSMREWSEKKTEIDLCTIGAKGFTFLKRAGGRITAHVSHLGDAPRIEQLIGTVKTMLDDYTTGGIDRLLIVYSRFVNTITQH